MDWCNGAYVCERLFDGFLFIFYLNWNALGALGF